MTEDAGLALSAVREMSPIILEPSCHEYAGFWYEPLALDRI